MNNLNKMKLNILFLFSILFLISCSTNEEVESFHTTRVRGKVVRELTNEGIAGSKIYLKIVKTYGTGYFSYKKIIDSKEVFTNSEGFFEINMKNSDNTHLTVFKNIDDNYSQFGLSEDFPSNQFNPSEEITIKIYKLIKFRINVKNITPLNNEDYVYVSFAHHGGQAIRTEILNFGIPNIVYPAEGGFGPRIETAWQGMNVNSSIFYSVSENSQYYKLYWEKRKNGIFEKGVTDEIPHNINILNEYDFNY